MPEDRKWITAPKAGELSGYTRRWIIDLCTEGRIVAQHLEGTTAKSRGTWIVDIQDLRRYMLEVGKDTTAVDNYIADLS